MASDIKLTNAHGKTVSIVGDDNITQDITYNLSKNMYTVDTVADLRSMTSVPEYVYASGYHTANDGAFGSHFYRLATDTGQLDNSGTIIRTVNGVYELQFSGNIYVEWFGAISDTTTGLDGTDNTNAFIASVEAAVSLGGGTITMNTGKYSIRGTVVIPSTVTLDLGGSFIYGNGVGATNDLFQSGTVIDGIVESNVDKGNEVALVTKMGICNGTILNTGKALNLLNCIWQTEFRDIEFLNCTYAIYSNRCFYSRFVNLISRGVAGFATNAAFHFLSASNVIQMESIFVTDRILGMHFSGGSNGLGLYNCSAESNTVGVLVESTTGPITFNSCYFELNTSIGVDVNTLYDKFAIAFIGCFFNANSNEAGTAIGIRGNAGGIGSYSSIIIDRSCYFQSNDINIDSSSNSFYNQDFIEYSDIDNVTVNTIPVFPANIKAGAGTNVNIFRNAQGGASIPILKSKIHGNSLIPFHYEGTAGTPTTNANGFMAITRDSTVPTAYIVTIDTDLDATGVANMFVYNILVGDTQNSYYFRGFIFGTTKQELFTPAGKTITVNNNNGNIQIVLTPFNGAANIQAAIRHI